MQYPLASMNPSVQPTLEEAQQYSLSFGLKAAGGGGGGGGYDDDYDSGDEEDSFMGSGGGLGGGALCFPNSAFCFFVIF